MAGAVVLTMLLGEGALRLAGMRYDASLYTPDPVLGWALRPGARGWNTSEGEAFITINRGGQRDVERTVDKPAGTYRVAVLGDSMVEARQVPLEQTFTQHMERELKRCARQAVQVLNFGVRGFGTAQELLMLRSRVWAYHPDLVVLSLYVGNDLYDNLRPLDYTAAGQRPYFVRHGNDLVLDDSFRLQSVRPDRIRFRNWAAELANHSVLALLLNHARHSIRRGPPRPPLELGAEGLRDYYRLWMYRRPTRAEMVEAWATTEALVTAFRDEVRQRGSDFAMLYVPMPAETEWDTSRREAFQRELDEDGAIDYPRKRLSELAVREGAMLLDPTEALLKHAAASRTYVYGFRNTGPNHGHWNEEGHRLVGEFVVDSLCASGLLRKGDL